MKGYRWIETGHRVWQLESPLGSRRFHGCVAVNHGGWFVWYTRAAKQGESFKQGEAQTKREAMAAVERLACGEATT